ncbi:unnamed protein product (macronuclear) [Paramecium tetraurelia]|uniref:EGF-like domain-containing protein n=1 Tax=Paramecium tetraurelia TaxID=5888 RepID=A0DXB7_PARTE|nr:uncharacterized protein GSPATT00021317001 [Paramecium tetraurelia]CAK87684.1 unnamed protein product [Paramecium tetraurelia]|eukprot:XP_001455081.1 hypothetical protein (macronuclear) [Paramecium tetraurelia strain d4-2]
MLFLLITIVLSKEDQSIRISQSCATYLTGYFWNGQQCIQCKQPSCKCQKSQGCDTCLNQYYYDSTAQTCTPCPKGCIKCCKSDELTQYICTLCLNGYIMINGVCLKVDACTQISIHGRCQKCIDKYFLQESCQACPEGCSACDSKYYCTVCDDGYYLAINEQSVSCLTCNPEEDREGCKSCVLDSKQLICLDCLDTYYFDQENDICLKCPVGCFTCQNPSQLPQICYTCLTGYLLAADDSYCENCQQQIPNCMKCSTNERSRNFQCVDCNNGYYLTQDSKSCQPCNNGSNNFRRCESLTHPTQCSVGYLLFQNSNSYTCVLNTHSCYTIDNIQGQCKDCNFGFNLVLDTSLQMSVCKNCTENIKNCITCDVDNSRQLICKECIDGYYGNLCVQCTSNCKKCLNESQCLTCSSGYYLDDSNKCQSCEVSFCMECTKLKECARCENNYGLSESICKPCLSGCQNCDGNLEKCNVCSDKYYLTATDNNCKRYKENCLATNVNGYCYLCETQITYDQSQDRFYDEGEETPIFDEQADSQFYISNNGYCLKCNDYVTGSFNCPQICKVDEEFASHLLPAILILLIFQ